MLNKAILIGHVGQDPEMKDIEGGKHFAVFNLATSESWKDKSSGERKQKTEWHRVVVFNEHLVDVVNKYVRKGSKLYIEGKITTRKWTDKDGNERYATEINLNGFGAVLEMLDRKEGGGNRPPDEAYQGDS